MTVQSQPVCEIFPNGVKYWKLNGELHRENGPAVECPNGYKAWCQNNKTHREDGPAIEYPDGRKLWFLENEYLDPEKAIKDHELKEKYPKLIESFDVYLVHSL